MTIKKLMMGAGATGLTSGAVQFDGSTYLERGGDLTGNSDSDYCTFSFWYRYDNNLNDNSTTNIYETDSNKFKIVNASTGIQVEGRTASNVREIDAKINTDHNDTTNWHHVCGRVDSNSTANTVFFVDDSSAVGYAFGSAGGGAIDFTLADHTIGAKQNGITPIVMSIYELWIGIGQNFDISSTSNRRKFIDAGGAPVDLGSDGSTPTGTAPKIYMTGTPAEFVTNLGSGGNFSVTAGALIDVGPPTTAGSP